MKEDCKILVIDDSKTMYTMITKFLMAEGYKNIDHAQNGQIGIDMLKNQKYDLVTLDVDMPVLDGFTTAQEMLKICPSLKILFLSARQGEYYINKAKEIHIDNYLCKPFKPKQLIKAVSRILDKE